MVLNGSLAVALEKSYFIFCLFVTGSANSLRVGFARPLRGVTLNIM